MKIAKSLKKIVRHFRDSMKLRLGSKPYKLGIFEIIRLKLSPRKSITSTKINLHKIWLTDPYWFIFNHREIFEEEIYKFTSKRPDPLIIDCGSNIGLSIIYFNSLYPQSKIIGFEPDPEIFRFLEQNLEEFSIPNIELHQKAVWTCETELLFVQDGSLGGKIVKNRNKKNIIEIQSMRLRDLLTQPIDFLKIDIEGAEYDVLEDCKDKLELVDHIFIEYHGLANETQKLHKILEMINATGFRYHIKEANPIQHPFISKERSNNYDLQLNIFAFRV